MANFLTVMSLITDHLHGVYGDKMHEQVALITPYARQKQMYAVAFNRLRHLPGWSDAHPPMLGTEDSVVESEHNHVIVDYVACVPTHKELGFPSRLGACWLWW
ncbi:hypothetical protein BDY17DRAFT_307757 [Neohortaea acidophila]|uniref:DNA2/NAM7 helicase-like C-terminal domain-containing protein n=1 Tax=Neohortaea acidophila TaxID=245834 RepID=A0A6A6Q179_9PEZI|nr:uncharacterized protein BDY17DRAFT_307757 [Neohortaea acidophila]KAF2486228.1 hypothetical protein BDY17DRAFT_307757 [Neohortaea acidophila]